MLFVGANFALVEIDNLRPRDCVHDHCRYSDIENWGTLLDPSCYLTIEKVSVFRNVSSHPFKLVCRLNMLEIIYRAQFCEPRRLRKGVARIFQLISYLFYLVLYVRPFALFWLLLYLFYFYFSPYRLEGKLDSETGRANGSRSIVQRYHFSCGEPRLLLCYDIRDGVYLVDW